MKAARFMLPKCLDTMKLILFIMSLDGMSKQSLRACAVWRGSKGIRDKNQSMSNDIQEMQDC